MVEVFRDVLLNIKTCLEIKGVYKFQITKNDYVCSTIKIRMRDDATHILKLTHGEYLVKVLLKDKEHLVNTMILPIFENGSQIKVLISDTGIELDLDEIIPFRHVDDFMNLATTTEKQQKKEGLGMTIKKQTGASASKGKTFGVGMSNQTTKENTITLEEHQRKVNEIQSHYSAEIENLNNIINQLQNEISSLKQVNTTTMTNQPTTSENNIANTNTFNTTTQVEVESKVEREEPVVENQQGMNIEKLEINDEN